MQIRATSSVAFGLAPRGCDNAGGFRTGCTRRVQEARNRENGGVQREEMTRLRERSGRATRSIEAKPEELKAELHGVGSDLEAIRANERQRKTSAALGALAQSGRVETAKPRLRPKPANGNGPTHSRA